MLSKILLAATGVMVAGLVSLLFDGNFALACAAIVAAVLLGGMVTRSCCKTCETCPGNPMERLIEPFRRLSAIETSNAESAAAYIYEDFDIDIRSELSECVLDRSLEHKILSLALADRIRQFREDAILKIDERIDADAIPHDTEWCKLFCESRHIYNTLTQMNAG